MDMGHLAQFLPIARALKVSVICPPDLTTVSSRPSRPGQSLDKAGVTMEMGKVVPCELKEVPLEPVLSGS